ncbi:hypothetical protein [Cellulomonas sp.]|uniref:hypothetical protein n=1 Tax=Cellulomonas sp. TaxID=40001 RepID=UPI001B2C8727|nr:hypothetical protein [Cellulomonas sp.]MBO9555489.1 hypothetical protein [Cellulomonas sp.]
MTTTSAPVVGDTEPAPEQGVSTVERASGGSRFPFWGRALVGGVAGVVLVLAALTVASVPGEVLLALLAVATLLVPTSRELSRRILVAGPVLLGGLPMLWWWKLPLADVGGHAGLLLALLVGGVGAWLLAGPRPLRRARLLLPRVRWVDGVLAVAVLVAAWVYLPSLRPSSPEVALSRLLRGWDNSAHFDMASMLYHHGVVISHIEPGPLGQWSYAQYPQGFHTVTATVMEALLGPGADADPGVVLATYARSMTLVVLLAVAMVLAGICSLPALRRRPFVAFPALMFVVATFTLGPGGMLLHDGFPNFIVAVAFVSAIPLLVVQMTRPLSPVFLAALGGAAVGIAHNWSLLLSMGALGVVAVFFPRTRLRWTTDRRAWVAPAVITLITLVGLAQAWTMLRHQPGLGNLLGIGGGVTPVPLGQLVLTSVGAVAACVFLLVQNRRPHGPWSGDAVRTAWTGLVPLAGIGFAAALAFTQIRAQGDVAYYFWKYSIAVELVSSVVLVVALVMALRPVGVRRTVGVRAVGACALVVTGVAALLVYGLPKVLPTSLGGGVAPGGVARADFVALGHAAVPAQDAIDLVAAARAPRPESDGPRTFLPYPWGQQVPPMMSAQWFDALTGRWIDQTQRLLPNENPTGSSPQDAIDAARKVLRAEPDVIVVVGPQYVDAVKDAVADEGWSDRVQSW